MSLNINQHLPCDKDEINLWHFVQTRMWGALKETWDRFQRDDGSLMSAATAFYAGLSLIPLLIVLISGLGILLETTQFGIDARHEILATIETETSPLIRSQFEELLDNLSQKAPINGPLGLAGLLLGGMAVFAQFERAFDRIWNIEARQNVGILKSLKRIVLLRFRAFLMMCGLGLLVLIVFVAGLTIDTLEAFASRWWPIPPALRSLTEWSVSLVINTLVFLLLYRFLPKVAVRWRE
ncbi:MAG: YihY/virulence factor BrkB family protein, partial [Planctomycetaceae bacterium]|nr:YihY/virulence factor BrkB family protein [Planctomycetaceae bacterium]